MLGLIQPSNFTSRYNWNKNSYNGKTQGKTQNFTVSVNNEGTGCDVTQACMSHPMVIKSGRLVGTVTLNDTLLMPLELV